MITFITQWFQGKRRLLTEYALLACLVSLGGLAFSLWVSRMELRNDLQATKTDLEGVRVRLTLTEASNAARDEAFDKLSLMRQIDSSSIEELFLKFGTISSNRQQLETTIQQLEKTDDSVQKYLDADVPDVLGCVLEPTTCPTAPGSHP